MDSPREYGAVLLETALRTADPKPLSYYAAAKLCSCSQEHISRIVRGLARPGADLRLAFQKHFRIPASVWRKPRKKPVRKVQHA